jgi:hypothetical protein
VDAILTYRGKTVTAEDIAFIRRLIEENPFESRRRLSQRLCLAWNWVQPNGALRDQVCRSLMLELERGGHIELPPRRFSPPNPLADRRKPALPSVDQTPVVRDLSRIETSLEILQVRRSPLEELFNGLIEHFHYLGYTQPVGEHLKHLVLLEARPIACFSWSSAPRHIGCRDRFIGWSPEMRRKNLHLIAYNTRFLILPWVRIPCLASHLLSGMARRLSFDWQRLYDHPLCFVETFVDTERFKGACYKAANWIYLGKTLGLGKDAKSRNPNRSIKDAYGYPLHRRFRSTLCH